MTSKKGAIPIPYIVALVLAVILLSILAYWVFSSSGEFNKNMSEQSCRAKKLAYCSAWKLNLWDDEKKPNGVDDFSASCEIANENRENYYSPECCEYSWAYPMTKEKCES